jgi:beta-galactosidase
MGLLLGAAAAAAAEPPVFVWMEGEDAAVAGVKPNIAGWGHKEFLSGEKWLHISVEADKVERQVPSGGIVMAHKFAVTKEGAYEVWDRVGFEFVRSPIQWRIDGGEWATVGPEELTWDVCELDFWCEVAWLRLGQKQLGGGDHTLEIRLPVTKDDKGKTARILYASDAICLTAGPFSPNGPFKPGEESRQSEDLQAARTVFEVPGPPSAGARVAVPLKGLWQVCRHDEQKPGEVAEPIKDLPTQPHWRAIAVPGDKMKLRPDLQLAHRLWYRTRVRVAEALDGRSFHIVFPQNNLNTTVYVNGICCGFNKNPFARFDIDVTKAVKPGVNDVWVGIRDAYYGYSANPANPMKLRKRWNLPPKYLSDGWQDMSYPVWNHPQSGILATPEFVAAGPVRAADVFCKPSVAAKELALEVTLSNPSGRDASGEIVCEAVAKKTAAVEKTFAPRPFALAAGASQTFEVAEKWENPKLWWPDDPNLYVLRTAVRIAGKTVDVYEVTFGFREWTTQGKDFKLNGVPWHGWADCHTHSNKDDWLAFYRASNQTMMRFWGTSWMGLPPDEALDFFDAAGVVVRRSGIFDGEAMSYMVGENDPDLQKLHGGSKVKMDLVKNWQDQVCAQVKGERNHPSVLIWSIENEIEYINVINVGMSDLWEPETTRVSRAVSAVDPTRPNMIDGGGATKAQTLPVHGDHYTTGPFPAYPALAYTPNVKGGGRDRWVWDQKRPRFIGEELFAAGINPAYAYFGGEEVFQGKAQNLSAVGIFVRMLTEGYRWNDIGAWHFWQGQNDARGQYDSNAPRAVFCRQWDWTFGSGQKVPRRMALFNDTRYADPIAYVGTLTVGGRKVASDTRTFRTAPGTHEEFDVTIEMPKVAARQEGEWVLSLAVGGKEVYKDTKAVSVLNTDPREGKVPGLAALTASDLCVYDPASGAAALLKDRGVPFTSIAALDAFPQAGKILLVGRDAITPNERTSPRFAAMASVGKRVIILEQTRPLQYQGLLPAEMEAASNEGRTAFGEDLGHPALRGLQQKDFFTWAPDEIVYRNAYLKPTRGAKSLVQCHEKLQNSALVEVPVGSGLMLLCQLAVEEKAATNPVAQALLLNLVAYAAQYKLEFRPVAAAVQGDPQLPKVLDAISLKYAAAAGPVQAIETAGAKLAVVAASPANLEALADNSGKVRAFTDGGGWIVLAGLTPDGLASYNKIVGFDHMIRPFRREKVMFAMPRSALTAGLTTPDVALYSSEQIFPWQSGNFIASDTFSYVVDYDEVASFAKFDNDFLANMANGMVSADAWKYIVNVPAPDKPPLDFRLPLPKEQEIVEMEWIGNTFYYPVTKVQLIFDGRAADAATFDVRPNNDPQTFPVAPPRKGKDLTLRLADWTVLPDKNKVTGLDNIRLKAARPAEFYRNVRPMLNVGGLMEYPRGAGGIVLCNVLFKDAEQAPENAVHKRNILAAILRNLKAPFATGKMVIAGANLKYSTIDISKHANQYRTDRGWFGDARFTFKDMPAGRQKFAGVPFEVYDFPTSPVPTVIMLGGAGVPNNPAREVRGISVGCKADALFFLHAARIDARINDQERKDKKKFEMLRYVVTYADGKTENVPVYAEVDIDDYRQKEPRAIPGAQVAWTAPFAGTEFSAVAYSKQWNNPRPDVEIKSLDMVYGAQPRGVPVLIAVTAASAE